MEAHIRSCISHDHYSLDDALPETVIKGHTADISTICGYKWYECVIYNDTTWKFPEPQFALGQYLGPDIDVGSVKTSETLRKTGEVVPRSTLWDLTLEKMKNTDLK